MAYFAPYIDATGPHIPTFSDIQGNLVNAAQSIFGSDIYLDGDSQDMQYIGALSMALNDAMQMCLLAYNNMSPQSSLGVPLDNIVKINGIRRLDATYSTCVVVLQGFEGTVIPAGVVQDKNGYLWDLPTNITIPTGGILNVTAACEVPGAITASAGDIQTITTPQYGWNAVYNAVAATPGTTIETDTALRLRQGISVELPSQSPLAGTLAAIEALDGVTRAQVYENKDSTPNGFGIPGHTIAAVVEGGDNTAVAEQIAMHKTIGCGTYGSLAIDLPAESTITGAIQYSRPAYVAVSVNVTVVPIAAYTTSMQNNIISNIQTYLTGMDIGATVYASSLYSVAMQATPDIKNPAFAVSSIQIAGADGNYTNVVDISWNQVAKAGTITISGGY